MLDALDNARTAIYYLQTRQMLQLQSLALEIQPVDLWAVLQSISILRHSRCYQLGGLVTEGWVNCIIVIRGRSDADCLNMDFHSQAHLSTWVQPDGAIE